MELFAVKKGIPIQNEVFDWEIQQLDSIDKECILRLHKWEDRQRSLLAIVLKLNDTLKRH
ncbi:hypothetical protein J5Y03_15800 [Bacillus sp. RG28]|uniref:Uncharacterized protein n=1 Tax=Gottfriedia endophytica TaxID=2820819 RepID=A0A940NLF6_9BACI|nr:hypothetical protein [Gottfriedia endophytica]MBP0726625.1 hypothetical protein [Gottfriedia endophytica]